MACVTKSEVNDIRDAKDFDAIVATQVEQVVIADEVDDDCVICYQTLYRPVKTKCGHSACESCMLYWTLTAMDTNGGEIALPTGVSVEGISFKCPTCRTYTTAHHDKSRDEYLAKQYPSEYASRAAELGNMELIQEDEFATQTMILMFGNSHRRIEPSVSPYSGKMRTHEFTFFVQSSRVDLIDRVEVILHPTFRQDRYKVLTESPFSTTHKSWGSFTIVAGIQLKKGWQWVDESMAVDSSTARQKDKLPLDWPLDYNANGSQRNRLVKFRKVEESKQELKETEDLLDSSDLALFMTEAEIAQLREVRRLKAAARRAQQLEVAEQL